tara:strand:- start:1728 stop:2150 length:423 start_codon:yes stop_codon:yes gene_type:complete
MINWDDFNYDDLNWREYLKNLFDNDEKCNEGSFDPNDWYAAGATYSYEEYKDKMDGNYQEWLKGELLEEEIDDEELRYYENDNLYESLCGLNDMPSNKSKRILEKDNIFHSGKDKIIKELISYFEELEEYEKCANLLKLL